MKIIIHRGTHQIGGAVTEICTNSTRIIIDMGDELSTDTDFTPARLNIAGVSDSTDRCDAVLFTHYHGDHIKQLGNVREEIPIYMGALARDILLLADRISTPQRLARVGNASFFESGNRCVSYTPAIPLTERDVKTHKQGWTANDK